MNIETILTYGSLLLSVIFLWINGKVYKEIRLWMLLLGVAFVFALIFHYANFISLTYTIVFGVMVYLYFKTNHIAYFLLTLALSLLLLIHWQLIGFNNYQFLNKVIITNGAVPFSLYFNFDKVLVGIFILGFGYTIRNKGLKLDIKQLLIHLVLMVSVLLLLALLLGYTRFEPKIPHFTLVWMLVNLFFVCPAEEALFRGLIQQKLTDSMRFKNGYLVGIFIASLIFGLAHLAGGIIYVLLATIAGLFYGLIYYKTKRIENSILLHFLFNLTHFLLFTYPAINSGH